MLWWRGKSGGNNAAEVKTSVASQLVSPTSDFLALFGITPSVSGAIVSPFTAMRVPAVRAAVLAISEALGQVEAHVYSTGANAERATNHPAYPLLHDAVNAWTSATEFREQLTRDALLHGNGYAAIIRDGDGAPVELHRMQPERVAVYVQPATLEPSYQFSPLTGALVTYGFADVIHLRTSSLDGVLGESPVMQAREAIGLALVMEAYAGRLFANGARPSGALTLPGKLAADAIARIKASLQALHGGSSSGGTMVLEEGTTFTQTALSSVDAQFLEMRAFAINEIARTFRISPILLGEMGRATFANSAEMGRQFITYTLLPWVRRWEGEIALKLLSPDERAGYRIELDTDDFDRADIAARATAYSSMIAARVMNANECRELESLPPYTGGEAFLNPNVTTETVRV